jgi:hypothetical protein
MTKPLDSQHTTSPVRTYKWHAVTGDHSQLAHDLQTLTYVVDYCKHFTTSTYVAMLTCVIQSFACPLPTNRMRIRKVVYLFIYLATMSEARDCMASNGRMTGERAGKDMEENCRHLLHVLSLHEHYD